MHDRVFQEKFPICLVFQHYVHISSIYIGVVREWRTEDAYLSIDVLLMGAAPFN